MKVKLAAELLSASVADALKTCRDMQIAGFENCDATITFLKSFNDLFDILNTRNLAPKGLKRLICPSNYEVIKERLLAIEEYIKKMKYPNGQLLIESRRKTGFIGFLMCIRAVIFLYENYASQNESFWFLPTYKLSQDHLEIFFGAIRAQSGFNNNPSAKLFTAAYKKLLVHAEFKQSRNGNCLPLDEIKILQTNMPNYVQTVNESMRKNNLLVEEEKVDSPTDTWIMDSDHKYLDYTHLSEYTEHVIGYIAGYVARKIEKDIHCEECRKALIADDTTNLLITNKNRGGLIKPSLDVIKKVCNQTEKILKFQINNLGVKM